MSQVGFTPISIYYSSTAAAVPTAGNLVAGELAINTADGKLFYKDSAGVVQTIAGKGGAGVAGGSTTQVQYNSSGSLAGSANMTFSGTALTLANDASISGLTVGKGGGALTGNTVVGNGALAGTNTGTGFNNAFGQFSLAVNTSGNTNNAFGYGTLTANTSGYANSAFGHGALNANSTGISNTAIGLGALISNTTASNNTAVGYQAGYSATTAGANTYIGYQAGYAANRGTASNVINTFVGYGSGSAVTDGYKNTIIGSYSGNQGGLDIRSANNYIVLSDGDGNPHLYSSYNAPNYGLWCNTIVAGTGSALVFNTSSGLISYSSSSSRYKENIKDTKYGLADVIKMRPVTFDYISDKTNDVGFIAEEMVNIIPEVVGKNKEGQVEYINYDKLTSVLVKAIQELKAEFDAYKATHP
jgi:hypothetical protein